MSFAGGSQCPVQGVAGRGGFQERCHWSIGQEAKARPWKPHEGPCSVLSYRLKENYILLSTDGPGRNVLKFKPPMCFSLDNVQHVVAKLDAILTGEPEA